MIRSETFNNTGSRDTYMDYWIFVDYNTEERKEKIDKAVKILQDLDFKIPALDSEKRIIAFLAESSHTSIDFNESPTIQLYSSTISNENTKIEKVSNILDDIGFETQLSIIKRENKSKFKLNIEEGSIGCGIKWHKIENKTSTKA